MSDMERDCREYERQDAAPTKSDSHIAFVRDTHGSLWEYWTRGDSIYRQNVHAPVMPDGFRSGRWYCYASPAAISNLTTSGVTT